MPSIYGTLPAPTSLDTEYLSKAGPHTLGTAAVINPFANEEAEAQRGCLTSPKSLHALISLAVIKMTQQKKQLREGRVPSLQGSQGS